MSWAVAIWKERINGNLEEAHGVVPSKWVNEEEKYYGGHQVCMLSKSKTAHQNLIERNMS